MHPDLEKMIPLQALDIEARRLRDEIEALPRHLAKTAAIAHEAAARQAALAAELATEDALRRRLQSDVQDLLVKSERTRKKIDAATTTVQVTALEHEAQFARGEIARLEDAELESMERSERLDAQTASAKQELALAELTLSRERERSAQSLAQDRAALVELGLERQALRTQILQSETGEASLAVYDRIAKARGTAVSEALLGKCSACGMMLRPQLWQDLRDNSPDSPSRHTLSTCENCGRLLFYDPARDAPQRKQVQGESIAAAIVRSAL